MKVKLIKIYTQCDPHDIDIEMFRVYKIVDLLIEPKRNHKIVLNRSIFYIHSIEQNLKNRKIYLYEQIDIPHYKFWDDKKAFTKKYLPKLLKAGWTLTKKEDR